MLELARFRYCDVFDYGLSLLKINTKIKLMINLKIMMRMVTMVIRRRRMMTMIIRGEWTGMRRIIMVMMMMMMMVR